MLGTYALLVAMVAVFLALALFLGLVAYDLVVVPPWEVLAPALAAWAALHGRVLRSWIAGHVTGVPSGRHARHVP